MLFPSYTKIFHHDLYPAIEPTRSELSAANKTVLITGGGQGIGASIARAFSLAGAKHIILLGRNEPTLSQTAKGIEVSPTNKSKIHIFVVDITDEARVKVVFDQIVKQISPIDVFVANAGALADPTPLATALLVDFWKVFETNVKGFFLTTRAFLQAANPTGSTMINVSTGAAHAPYLAPMASYTASKAASTKIMDSVAAENPTVKAYSMHPGIVETAMSAKSGMKMANYDTPELPAAFAVWLNSPEAEFLRGRFLSCNWDVDELKARKAELEKDPMALTIGLKDQGQHFGEYYVFG
ncbi:hypothetical protein MMC09_003949 [Bachmanniomyces sp. S44760]|nr:hypothetical protein [Bachmanniomyces sp. S44760]